MIHVNNNPDLLYLHQGNTFNHVTKALYKIIDVF